MQQAHYHVYSIIQLKAIGSIHQCRIGRKKEQSCNTSSSHRGARTTSNASSIVCTLSASLATTALSPLIFKRRLICFGTSAPEKMNLPKKLGMTAAISKRVTENEHLFSAACLLSASYSEGRDAQITLFFQHKCRGNHTKAALLRLSHRELSGNHDDILPSCRTDLVTMGSEENKTSISDMRANGPVTFARARTTCNKGLPPKGTRHRRSS